MIRLVLIFFLIAIVFCYCVSPKKLTVKLPHNYTGWVYLYENDTLAKNVKKINDSTFNTKKVSGYPTFKAGKTVVKPIYAFKYYLNGFIPKEKYSPKDTTLLVYTFYSVESKFEHREWSTPPIIEPRLKIAKTSIRSFLKSRNLQN